MDEISRTLETWIYVELVDQEIAKLKEDILSKICKEDRIDLLPFYGLLYFKDKMWIGIVKRFTPSRCLLETLKLSMQSIDFYVIESEHKIADEMKTHTPVPELEIGVSVHCLSLPSSSDFRTLYQQFGEYFITIYGKVPQQKSLKRRLILGLERKFEDAWFGEEEKSHNKIGHLDDAKPLWTLKAKAFIAVLRSQEDLPSHTAEHPDYEVREMSLSEIFYAVKHWKFSSESAKYRFACSRNIGLAVGAFQPGCDSPVSWAFTSWDGAISALNTMQGHQGKGLAKAIIRKLSSKLFKYGVFPFVYIEIIDTSFIPESLFSSLGFTLYKDIRFCWKYPC